ncbi:MAG: pyruvate dehydrogenase complex dihydrolipoamide acetyltransferase [Saprospiraceae bacterium]|jgi:pyruvate dehydrogenase E2 component (dihydrolipoamide acetyltransferase)|nr:pyruvate dehydrogenase complex dihydrolipoamide acetyltransferase [Saprospiraceae bacterium]MDP4999625.1 pyruvate dehydrogenase complex dihydrolipoamide acetyltransferase [Saprospiraceae bacterium]
MAEVIRMPRMSDTMEEGNIIGWLKSEGDQVEAGETLAEVETDKATMELDSYTDGVLLHIAVKEGTVPIDGIIAIIGQAGEDWKHLLEGGAQTAAPAPAAAPVAAEVTPATPAVAAPSGDTRVKASPLAKSIARQQGLDISSLIGSGDNGRVVKKDIEAALQGKTPAPQAVVQPAPVAPAEPAVVQPIPVAESTGTFEDKRVSQMRKVIAKRLSESKFGAPHFYLNVEINMEKAIQMRQQVNAVAEVKISFNDFVIRAAAAALRQHPAINASWLGDAIRYHKQVNIGVAVAIDDGLIVPVIRNADIKTLSQINTEVKTMAGKARDRKLQPEEMQGNTFTISNLGMFGIESFTAIINPPDACIMAVGAIIEKPIVKDGTITIGNMMKVTLSCDHRVVDGALGAQFLQTFKAILEDPIRLLV